MKKYELLENDFIEVNGRKLFRIKSLKNFADVKVGDLGGYIESEFNLSHSGNCWIYNNAKVYDNATVYDNAFIYDNAEVYGNARVYHSSKLYNNSKAYDDAKVYDFAKLFDNSRVYNGGVADGFIKLRGSEVLTVRGRHY